MFEFRSEVLGLREITKNGESYTKERHGMENKWIMQWLIYGDSGFQKLWVPFRGSQSKDDNMGPPI